jgi:pilus assembly protein FimV
VKPEGVTLEQMLVSLYRTNPDAFTGNMNRLKTGRILRVPEKEQVAETAQPEAVKEVRVQASNWNAYRQKLAGAAAETTAQESKSPARGKITTSVDDKALAKEPPKEVLKLSKGDTTPSGKAAGGKPMSAQDRTRMLEEEVTAREKALAEANDRIAQLEKTIKDMQRLLEIKGQVPAKPAAPPAATPPAAPPAAVSPPPVVPAPAVKPEAVPAPPAAPRTDQVIKPDVVAPVVPPVVPPPPLTPAEPPKDAVKPPAETIKPEGSQAC